MIIVDDVLSDFDRMRTHCDQVDYSGVVNPEDGVLYPGISVDIPKNEQAEVKTAIEKAIGVKISVNRMFLRVTKQGDSVPHSAHNDALMGDGGAILYLSRKEHSSGGTSFVTHIETGMSGQPESQNLVDVWRRDTNDYKKWRIDSMCEMEPNRMLVFDANRMHRAEPPTGFGDSGVNGRLVLVCFYGVLNG